MSSEIHIWWLFVHSIHFFHYFYCIRTKTAPEGVSMNQQVLPEKGFHSGFALDIHVDRCDCQPGIPDLLVVSFISANSPG
jgi:hypothetical protein